MSRALLVIAIFVVGFLAVAVAIEKRNCAHAREQYTKWGFYTALTKAPEALDKLREYQKQVEKCE